MWLDETTSPSTSSSSTIARLEALVGAQQVGVALRLVAEAEVLADRHVRRAERADEHVVDELLRAARGELAVERDHDELLRRRASRRAAALRRRSVSRRGAAPGCTTAVGCGSNVSTVSAPAMTSRWPRCTPSKVPTATRRGRGCDVGQARDPHARKPTTGFSAPSRALGDRDRPVGVDEQHRRGVARRSPSPTATPCAARRASSPVEQQRRHEAQRVRQRDEPRRVGVGDRERPDRRAPQLGAVRVAEVGDQRAHVRAGRALDRERRAVVLAPQLLEAVDGDRPLVEHDLLPRPRALVGALAVDLDRAVGRRALQQLAGRQLRRVGRHAPGLDDLALGVAGRRRRAEPRDRLIGLRQRHEVALDARRAPDEDEQQAGRERVERAGVPDPPPAVLAAHGRDDVVRGLARGLVDEQDAVGHALQATASAAAAPGRELWTDVAVTLCGDAHIPPPERPILDDRAGQRGGERL